MEDGEPAHRNGAATDVDNRTRADLKPGEDTAEWVRRNLGFQPDCCPVKGAEGGHPARPAELLAAAAAGALQVAAGLQHAKALIEELSTIAGLLLLAARRCSIETGFVLSVFAALLLAGHAFVYDGAILLLLLPTLKTEGAVLTSAALSIAVILALLFGAPGALMLAGLFCQPMHTADFWRGARS